ncbi:MAG: hypothetical protein ACLPKW_24300 [Acetobacteraceae bacterium]
MARFPASRTSAPDFDKPASGSAGAKQTSRAIKLSTPKRKPANLPKTAALTKAQADHKKWLKAHGMNTLRT